MSITFHNPINNVSTTVGSGGYTAHSGSLIVATGTGSKFGSTFPLIITASQNGTVYSILEVTGRSTDTLTISGAIELTTDVDLAAGVTIDMRPTALAITEIQSAVNGCAELAGATFTGMVTAPKYGTAGSSAGYIVTRRDTGAYAWEFYSATGSLQLYNGVTLSDALSIDPSTNDVSFAANVIANNFFTSGSGAGYLVTRRDTGASTWEFYSATGALQVRNGVTMSDALSIDPSTNVMTFNGSGVVLPTLADASAANGTIYLGSDHPDGNSAPRLCRKDSSGNVNVIG